MNEKLLLPEKFLFGAATSSHQVEGNTNNDWSAWELEIARVYAQQASEKRWPDHIKNSYPPPHMERNFISGKACEHYTRYEQDFDIINDLGHNAHRLSIEWSRIEPEEGKFDESEIEHYKNVLIALKERGIEPLVTCWHFTLPIWFSKKGGFLHKDSAKIFARYCAYLSEKLGAHATLWLTINEPMIYAWNGYFLGVWPPQQKKLASYRRVLKKMVRAHKLAYESMKEKNADLQIGVAKNIIFFEGFFSLFLRKHSNYYFLNAIRRHQDFIGLNYYFHNRTKGFRVNQNENERVSDMGWEIYPEGIYHALLGLRRYKRPVYITENGLADGRDGYRGAFIREHLTHVSRAIVDGVDVRGYLHWSLLDNFEWDKGFWPRFGLVEIDYKTMKRTPRESALEFKQIITDSRQS